MELLKKYWYFVILFIFLVIIIIFFSLGNPKGKLKNYLFKSGFDNIYQNEMQMITDNQENYDKSSNGKYSIVAFNYEKQNFSLLNKEKIDNKENVMTMSLSILNGYFTGSYTIANDYDEWFIKGTYDLKSENFTCDTMGYKGINEYCQELQQDMKNFKDQVESYLIFSKTDNYYMKKMYK